MFLANILATIFPTVAYAEQDINTFTHTFNRWALMSNARVKLGTLDATDYPVEKKLWEDVKREFKHLEKIVDAVYK